MSPVRPLVRPATTPRRIMVVAFSDKVDAEQCLTTVHSVASDYGADVVELRSDPWAAVASPEGTPGDTGEAPYIEAEHSPQVAAARAAARTCDVVVVLGGDGSFLRAADLARGAGIEVVGINLGHVGFLAERDRDELGDAMHRILGGAYQVSERLTLSAHVTDSEGTTLGDGWALNDLSLEKIFHRGILEATLAVDDRPVSAFGCDGMLVSTPTGSTAYAFSAGGPVLWPDLDALLVVPNNAHALFARSLVVAPNSVITIETAPTGPGSVVYLDGYRAIDVPSGGAVHVTASSTPVRWIRLDPKPFADRLVRKFRLPVDGWRGPIESGRFRRHGR